MDSVTEINMDDDHEDNDDDDDDTVTQFSWKMAVNERWFWSAIDTECLKQIREQLMRCLKNEQTDE